MYITNYLTYKLLYTTIRTKPRGTKTMSTPIGNHVPANSRRKLLVSTEEYQVPAQSHNFQMRKPLILSASLVLTAFDGANLANYVDNLYQMRNIYW